jgi:acyl-homoserine lactone acylase PvdQ
MRTAFYLMTVLLVGACSRQEKIEYFASEAAPAQQLALFAEALSTLEEDFGRWDIAWGEVNRYQRLDGEIAPHFDDALPSLAVGMASGRWGALASYGSRAWPGTRKLYGTSGNSFVAVVEFGERLRAKTLLAGGQSASSNRWLFIEKMWKRRRSSRINRVSANVTHVTKRAIMQVFWY